MFLLRHGSLATCDARSLLRKMNGEILEVAIDATSSVMDLKAHGRSTGHTRIDARVMLRTATAGAGFTSRMVSHVSVNNRFSWSLKELLICLLTGVGQTTTAQNQVDILDRRFNLSNQDPGALTSSIETGRIRIRVRARVRLYD